jgi:hypothetical protein
LAWSWRDGDVGHSAVAWAKWVWADGSGCGGSAVRDMGERRKESVVVKGEVDRWVPPCKIKRIQILNFLQTWFAPKVNFLGLNNLNKNTGR